MKPKMKKAYMKTAETFAELSYARRRKVGAIVVKDDRIISIGYNGMPAGWDNNCEFEYTDPQTKETSLVTRPEVLHAESNAIAKLAKSGGGADGAVLFVTLSPCLDCAKLIHQSGVGSVYYRDSYRSDSGVRFLQDSGIRVEQLVDHDAHAENSNA